MRLNDGLTELEGLIEHHIKGLRATGRLSRADHTGWLIYDLHADQMLASINIHAQLQAASMIKPFVALAFFHEVKRKRLNYGPISTQHMEQMIRLSSNNSTNWLMERVGGPRACHRILHRYYGDLVDQLSVVEYIPTGGRAYRNLASAADHARFLKALWHDKLPMSAEIKRVMNLPSSDRLYHGVPDIPAGTTVYNKTGTTAMCCGDMGVLVAQRSDGKRLPYIIVGVIDRTTRTNSYTSWSRSRANIIRDVSGLTYRFLRDRYGLA